MRIRLRFVFLLSVGLLAYVTVVVFNGRLVADSNLINGLSIGVNSFLATRSLEGKKLACVRPELDINDPTIGKFFKPSKIIKCDPEADWVCLDRGKAFVCNETLQKYSQVDCNYTFLNRVSDFVTSDGEVVEGNGKPVELKSDFFKVSCKNKNGKTWNNIMAGIRNDPSVHARVSWDKLPPKNLKMNVLIWGFDSLSRNTFMRKLPQTYSLLTDTLGAIVLKGYNIVGDGTPQALIPILTGRTELELPETRKRLSHSQHVNVYPFVWQEYKKHGYVLGHAEDCPSIGTFTYRLKGFDEQPTDHYMRAFYVAAERQYQEHKHLCLRGVPRHKVLMNWVRHFFTMYKDKPKFMFTFHSELSHGDYNLVGSTDRDLVELIQSLKDEGHLNNTLLIIMSDHGHRFAEIREHEQGKQEERMPIFTFTFPFWFERKYPQAMDNFRKNAERLTTPFDIYPTLRAILDFDENPDVGNLKNRSINLFSEVPESRTCEMAKIEPHWCACLHWTAIPNNSENALRAGNAVLNYINNLTKPYRKYCEVLTMKELVWAGTYTPHQDLLKFKKNADLDGFKADLTGSTKSKTQLYQVKFHTQPGNAHFEASLKYDLALKSFSVTEGDISRTNVYGHTADCVVKTAEQLRKYCFCKNQPNG